MDAQRLVKKLAAHTPSVEIFHDRAHGEAPGLAVTYLVKEKSHAEETRRLMD